MPERNYYDVQGAFADIENEMIASMMRNMQRHKIEEIKEKKEWAQWQAVQLAELNEYKKRNYRRFTREFEAINLAIEEAIVTARKDGNMDQEAEILEAVQNGYGYYTQGDAVNASFFKMNDRKMNALIIATKKDMNIAEHAMLRKANDKYRKIIFSSQVYAASGAATYEKAVDMAAKDFLANGIDCVKYKNGASHNIKDYADMVLRTTTKRAYLTGEGEMRKKWGIHLVIMNKRGNPCPKCLPFVGKVLVDDVWSGGKPDGEHKLMSQAIAAGLYHPRCKDSHTTYFGEREKNAYTKKEVQEIQENYKEEQKDNYAARQEEKFDRLSKNAIDDDNQRRYAARREEWKKRQKKKIHKKSVKKNEEIKSKEVQMDNNATSIINSNAVGFVDVTDKWLEKKVKNKGQIEYLDSVTYNGEKYKVDGKHVILDPSENEIRVAELIKDKFGEKIEIIPRIVYPENKKVADYNMFGEKYDLKTPEGNSKHTLYGMVKGKKQQSQNFIFDISKCGLSVEDAIEQIENDIYKSRHTRFVDKIILIKNDNILKIYKRE